MATALILEQQLEIPLNIGNLPEFRRWALSDEFPQRGRIDFIRGRIEVDMSPEDLFVHGTVKTELIIVLGGLVKQQHLGHLFSDATRVSSPAADLSAEPDILFISNDSIDRGAVRLVPKTTGEPHRYIELEGGPDAIIEIVSDSSVAKDKQRLPDAYFAAGVREFWLVDARGENLVFQIHRRADTAFEPVERDAQGFQKSDVFGEAFRLDRGADANDRPVYNLQVQR